MVTPFPVVVADPQSTEQMTWLRGLAAPLRLEIQAPATPDEAELKGLLTEAEGLIFHHRPVTADLIAAGARLRVIQKYGGLRNNIDMAATRTRSIAVALMPLSSSIAVAEHVLALMLACAKKLILAHRLTVTGAYRDLGIEPKVTSQESHGFQWMNISVADLHKKALGIYGFGDIGNEVAKRAKAFGMGILYNKRHRLDVDLETELGMSYASKDNLLCQSDFIVLTCPLTPETAKAIDARELALMKTTAYLINVSRGGLVDEPDLVEALRAHRIAGAGLDVFIEEPIPYDHPLLTLENVTLTPHSAGGKPGARDRQMLAVLANLKRFADGQPLEHQIA